MRQTTGFARVPDGGRIAFAVVGSGPAIVLPAWWVSHVAEDWHFDPLRRFMEGLAAGRMVVRYDRAGTGMSDRESSAEAHGVARRRALALGPAPRGHASGSYELR